MTPELNPTAEIHILGGTHTLKYGFRAFHALGVNPFDPASVKAFEEAPKSTLDLARQIWAGLLHEYHGRNAIHKGEPEPTLDDVLDELDPYNYLEIAMALMKVKGTTDEPKPDATEQPANPPQA